MTELDSLLQELAFAKKDDGPFWLPDAVRVGCGHCFGYALVRGAQRTGNNPDFIHCSTCQGIGLVPNTDGLVWFKSLGETDFAPSAVWNQEAGCYLVGVWVGQEFRHAYHADPFLALLLALKQVIKGTVGDKDSPVRKLHDEAMNLAELAAVAKVKGNLERVNSLLHQAYEYEVKAAKLLIDVSSLEPTRSVLLRSAASLAIDCNELAEAEKLIALGLSGNPPPELAEELRNLREWVRWLT